MKNSNDTIENRSHDLLVCNAVQPLRHHMPRIRPIWTNIKHPTTFGIDSQWQQLMSFGDETSRPTDMPSQSSFHLKHIIRWRGGGTRNLQTGTAYNFRCQFNTTLWVWWMLPNTFPHTSSVTITLPCTCIKKSSRITVYMQLYLTCKNSYMFRVYICSHHPARYRTMITKTIK
jgi:hypothetical protein